jgi:hypothetical protein
MNQAGVELYRWSALSHLQIGKYAEYFVKMEFTLSGFDVYSAEVDDKGIDFVVRTSESQYFDVQVKSARNLNYVFLSKSTFEPRANLLAALVLYTDGEPARTHLIPSTTWLSPNSLFVSRNFSEAHKSKPEWGLNLSKRNLHLLEPFTFEKTVQILKEASHPTRSPQTSPPQLERPL